MESLTKLGIIWIIALIYFPVGLNLVVKVNTSISILLTFIGIAILIYLTIHYSKDSKKVNKYEKEKS